MRVLKVQDAHAPRQMQRKGLTAEPVAVTGEVGVDVPEAVPDKVTVWVWLRLQDGVPL